MSFEERRKFLWILFLIGLVLIAVAANATTLARLRFDDMARMANAVARVRCLSSEPIWKNGEIWTETQFRVEEENKGTLPPIVIVQMPGGNIRASALARRRGARISSRRGSVSLPVGAAGRTVPRFRLEPGGIPHRS